MVCFNCYKEPKKDFDVENGGEICRREAISKEEEKKEFRFKVFELAN